MSTDGYRALWAVSEVTGVPRDKILSSGRSAQLVAARDMVTGLLRRTGMSYPEIGRVLGKDHSTIQAAQRRHMEGLAVPHAYAATFDRVLILFRGGTLVDDKARALVDEWVETLPVLARAVLDQRALADLVNAIKRL